MTVTRTDDSGNPLIQFERQSFQQVHGLGLLCVYTAVIIGISHSFGSPRMRKISVNLNMHPPTCSSLFTSAIRHQCQYPWHICHYRDGVIRDGKNDDDCLLWTLLRPLQIISNCGLAITEANEIDTKRNQWQVKVKETMCLDPNTIILSQILC